jgi:hypothetical protein
MLASKKTNNNWINMFTNKIHVEYRKNERHLHDDEIIINNNN